MSIEQLDNRANIPHLQQYGQITDLMYLIWRSRIDLQQAFDLGTAAGQEGFIHWYEVSVLREYGIVPEVPDTSETVAPRDSEPISLYFRLIRMESLIARLGRWIPSPMRGLARSFWFNLLSFSARQLARRSNCDNANSRIFTGESQGVGGLPGANLIGYAHAELGMGEHVRMSAAAFEATDVRFGVLNFDVGVSSRKQASLDYGQLTNRNAYRANLFHINADQMLKAYCHLGRGFFNNRYNVGYWAWELANCPEDWVPVIGMVDEIWAPSRFIQYAFAEKTSKPVEYMPLCVALPTFSKRSRAYFRLPENRFLFVFAFDFLSYIERKNPFATIRAFQTAFPDRSTPVGLVIKVMNGDGKNPQWVRMMEIIADDPRIHVLNQTMNREDVLALFDACDCFVSLHRSEGFGRGPAEAMYLGKPVIVTNYSGNTDFTRAENSCLVDYKLVSVKPGQYVFDEGQVWADADVEHAAWHMRRLVGENAFALEIGARGREFIHANYNPVAIGEIYAKRLRVLGLTE